LPVYACRLDPALIRPGRVDLKEKIDYANEQQLEQMFSRFYPDQPNSKAVQFAQLARKNNTNISLAQVQGLFLMYKASPDMVLQNVDLLKNM